MRFGKTMGKLFTVCEWIMRLAYLNLIWAVFTLAGLVVFGVMPATCAMFAVIRKWLMKETDLPIWKTFLEVYRKEFKKSNVLGFCLYIGGAFMGLDIFILRTITGPLQLALMAPLLLITASFIIVLLYIYPVYVHYDLKNIDYVKNAFFLGILNFHMTLLMLCSIAAIVFIIVYVPGLLPFFSVVSIAFVLMAGGNYSFRRIEARQQKMAGA